MPSTEIKASYNYQDRPEYKRNIISTSYTYSGSHKKLYFQFSPIQLNIVRLFNIDPSFYESLAGNPFMRNAYQDHFDFGLGGTMYYTTNTDVTPHSTYHYFRFQLNSAGNLLSLFNPLMSKNADGIHLTLNMSEGSSPPAKPGSSERMKGSLSLPASWPEPDTPTAIQELCRSSSISMRAERTA